MNRVAKQPVDSGDDLDALLGAFFKAEMPDPWPVFRRPAPRRALILPPSDRAWSLSSSRLVLAASVALLFLGLWLLPGFQRNSGDSLPILGGPEAARGRLPMGPPIPPAGGGGKSIPEKRPAPVEHEPELRPDFNLPLEDLPPTR